MKIFINFPFVVMIGVIPLLFQSCNESSDDLSFSNTNPALSNFTYSGCKGYIEGNNSKRTKGFVTDNMIPNETSVSKDFFYLKAKPDEKLLLIHQDASFSCDGIIKTKFRYKNDTIFITEMSTINTNCICNYDLTYTLNSFKETTYNVVIERQVIDYSGKPTDDVRKYGYFSFTYSSELSENKNIKYYEVR
ncbi:MAG: hypothetical protein ACOYJK_08110 [Prevotella sp.]|jgi:hypothetical protein